MPYRYATEQRDYGDYAGGKVFYSLPGHPALPARLASEVFQRCLAWRERDAPCVLYDPCCGGAYHLVTLGFIYGEQISAIVASDIDTEALSLAQRNLGLLTTEGLEARMAEIEEMIGRFGKQSHVEALESAQRLRRRLEGRPTIGLRLFQLDATDGEALRRQFNPGEVEVVLSDVPYGWQSDWQVTDARREEVAPVQRLLKALLPALAPDVVVAIVADKGQKIDHGAYQRLERFQIGKRQIVLLNKG